MNITIKTVPHHEQPFANVGDWRFDENGDLQMLVSDMGDWRYEALVALHELVEVVLCKHRGISTEIVDEFCERFEDERSRGLHTIEEEGGFDYRSPNRKEHMFATGLEMALAGQLGVDWNEYDKTVMEL